MESRSFCLCFYFMRISLLNDIQRFWVTHTLLGPKFETWSLTRPNRWVSGSQIPIYTPETKKQYINKYMYRERQCNAYLKRCVISKEMLQQISRQLKTSPSPSSLLKRQRRNSLKPIAYSLGKGKSPRSASLRIFLVRSPRNQTKDGYNVMLWAHARKYHIANDYSLKNISYESIKLLNGQREVVQQINSFNEELHYNLMKHYAHLVWREKWQ